MGPSDPRAEAVLLHAVGVMNRGSFGDVIFSQNSQGSVGMT